MTKSSPSAANGLHSLWASMLVVTVLFGSGPGLVTIPAPPSQMASNGAGYPATMDSLILSTQWTASGEAVGDAFGVSVGTAGDVNGDGFADLAVGAPQPLSNGPGKAYVYLGSPIGLSVSPAFTATGEAVFDQFGRSVSTAGDVNGDGFADLAVGAYGHNSFTGKVYVYHGSASGPGIPNGLSASPAFTATGEAPYDEFGSSVGTAGDVNGDGFADLAVGAPYNGNSATGEVYVYLGSAIGLGVTPAFTATGEALNGNFGRSVNTAGDVNGDGFADLAVGAPSNGNSATGKVYVYYGSPAGLSPVPDFTATGETQYDFFGGSVGTAGDANGDGCAELAVGAPFRAGDTGKVYVYFGSPAGLSPVPAFTATGEGQYDYFGGSVGTAGDVNGDGFADFAVGAFRNSSFTGKAYVYLGASDGLGSTPAFSAIGESPDDYFGQSVGAAGDVNGDGFADLAVGTPYKTGNTGKVYVYLGNATDAARLYLPMVER